MMVIMTMAGWLAWDAAKETRFLNMQISGFTAAAAVEWSWPVDNTFESRLVHAGDLRFAFGRRAFACKLNGVRSIFVRPMKVET